MKIIIVDYDMEMLQPRNAIEYLDYNKVSKNHKDISSRFFDYPEQCFKQAIKNIKNMNF